VRHDSARHLVANRHERRVVARAVVERRPPHGRIEPRRFDQDPIEASASGGPERPVPSSTVRARVPRREPAAHRRSGIEQVEGTSAGPTWKPLQDGSRDLARAVQWCVPQGRNRNASPVDYNLLVRQRRRLDHRGAVAVHRFAPLASRERATYGDQRKRRLTGLASHPILPFLRCGVAASCHAPAGRSSGASVGNRVVA
jgi:hypothetical protein